MGIKLMVEILDKAPDDMGAPERLLLLALAEKADDTTRRVLWAKGTNPRAVLMHRVGVSDSGLSKVLARLAKRGLDPRVARGQDRHGCPVYAFEGSATEYQVPTLRDPQNGEPLDGESLPVRAGSEPAETGTHVTPNGDPLEPESLPEREPLVPPSLTSPDARELDDAAARLLLIHGAALPRAEALEAAAEAARRYQPADLPSYVAHIPLDDLRRMAGKGSATVHRPKRQARRTCPGGHPFALDDGVCGCGDGHKLEAAS